MSDFTGDDEDDKFPAALIQEFRDDFGGWDK
jgi:hypothetical protein